MKANWFDWLVYRLFRWRWNRILASNSEMRQAFIVYMSEWRMAKKGEYDE